MDFKPFSENLELTGKAALVTGAASGIGRAISTLFVGKGAAIVLADLSAERAERLAAELTQQGARVAAIVGDVTDPDFQRRAVELSVSSFGGLDILVNSAGIGPLEPAETMTTETFDRTMDVNLRAPFLFSQLAARQMITQKRGGRIINLASQAGIVAIDGHTAYTTSKAGLIGLTKAMAFEWGRHGITVNAISPTVTRTELAMGYWVGDVADTALSKTPAGRFAEPEEIAMLTVYLASDASQMVTGANIVIDGGYTIN